MKVDEEQSTTMAVVAEVSDVNRGCGFEKDDCLNRRRRDPVWRPVQLQAVGELQTGVSEADGAGGSLAVAIVSQKKKVASMMRCPLLLNSRPIEVVRYDPKGRKLDQGDEEKEGCRRQGRIPRGHRSADGEQTRIAIVVLP